MNFGRGAFRLLIVVFVGWTLFCAVDVANREIVRADRAYAADCEIRRQTIAQFDLGKCLADPAAALQKRDRAIAAAQAWFLDGGYLFWLVPPFLITALGLILIVAGAFVYRGFVEE